MNFSSVSLGAHAVFLITVRSGPGSTTSSHHSLTRAVQTTRAAPTCISPSPQPRPRPRPLNSWAGGTVSGPPRPLPSLSGERGMQAAGRSSAAASILPGTILPSPGLPRFSSHPYLPAHLTPESPQLALYPWAGGWPHSSPACTEIRGASKARLSLHCPFIWTLKGTP